jgi:multiple sugar transport system substrate-binding protein
MTDLSHLSRRTILLGGAAMLGGALLVPTLSGCAQAGASGARPLKFWHLLSGGDGIVMAGLVDAANADNPEFHATQTVLAWGTPYYTKLAMASVGGRAPDVAIMHASRLPGYAPGGLLDPWDLDLLKEFDVTEEDFPPRIWEKGIIDGDLFSVALDAHPFIMMYNTDVAQKAGVLGENGQLVEITSPDQFLEVATAMQEVTGKHGLSYGYLGDGAQMWRLFYTFYKQLGADMTLNSGEPAQIDHEAAVTALDFIKKLLDGNIAATNGDYATAVAEFVNGESGMFFTGVWELPTAKNAGIPFDAQPIPNLFGTPAAYADSHAFVLPHQSRGVPLRLEHPQGIVRLGRGRPHPRFSPDRRVKGLRRPSSAGALRVGCRGAQLRPTRLVHRLRLGLPDLLRGIRPGRLPRRRLGGRHPGVRGPPEQAPRQTQPGCRIRSLQ